MATNGFNPSPETSNNQPQSFPYIPPGDSIVKNELNISNLVIKSKIFIISMKNSRLMLKAKRRHIFAESAIIP